MGAMGRDGERQKLEGRMGVFIKEEAGEGGSRKMGQWEFVMRAFV